MSTFIRSSAFLRCLVMLSLSLGFLTPPQTTAALAPTATTVDPGTVAEFFDELVPQQLAAAYIPGAVVTVVENGQVIFVRGYGYANVENQAPVDPEQTLFRIGSISKLFTWTAVMQLVEQGKLDLEADVNQYLDFKFPATFPQPITMKHLMSHTAGFEDDNFEYSVRTAADIVPMGEWLEKHQPARVRAPGQSLAYSNYGTRLAAYIVQRVSGLGFEDYVEKNILQPLNMTRTSPRQPNPAPLAAGMATGYQYLDASFQALPYDYDSCAGASSINSSAADMARFMLAHLQAGGSILKPETARRMQSILVSYHPRLNSYLYGFYEMSQNGLRIIGHSGDRPGFHSILALIPELGTGIFIAYNGEVPTVLQERTLEAFVDHFFPAERSEPQVNPSLQDAPRAAGFYRPLRSAYTSVEKVLYLLSYYRFIAQADGSLVLDVGIEQRRYVEVEPLVFQQAGGDDLFVFFEDGKGNITVAAHNLPTISMYERYPWFENPLAHQVLIGISLLVLISYLLAAVIRLLILLIGAAARALSRSSIRPSAQPSARWADVGLLLACVIVILFLVLFFMAVGDAQAIATGDVALARAALTCSTLVAMAAPVVIFASVWVWKRRIWKPLRRIHYTLGSVAVAALTFSFWIWNLIGWQF